MTSLYNYDEDYRAQLKAHFPQISKNIDSVNIEFPFHYDNGNNSIIGENVYINGNCTFLDGPSDEGLITIGANTLIGPSVQIYTPHHPLDPRLRRCNEYYSVTIGINCWIGGGAIICPGVTIGDRTVIGAGSVVTHDIPADSLAVGNPCRVIRPLEAGEDTTHHT